MSLKPSLVKGEDGKICMQVRLGQFTATLPLPDEMATWNEEQLKPFFERVVPEMTKGLIAMRTADERKRRRKACAGGSSKRPENSEAKILELPRQT